ncbi:hypothetical protein ANCDUO_16734 [Ancylostoma duodenale]|uniref:Uncharacterized protein n=1 Tax=Ancylostoma duodenale TaxID=51022 RepID=A0A0C2CTL3_9BILA|nr:hypothetical protein ANCDUO_16734 [Ancylostoma duodenale]
MIVGPIPEFDNTPGKTKTKRAKRGRKAIKAKDATQISACCRTITSRNPAVSDNSALGLFFTCPGSGRRHGTVDSEEYHCTIHDVTFADVAPDETDVSIFSLVRMISIYENEADIDKNRFLMRSPNHNFVTIDGAEKAYTFYKRNCEHVLKASLVHDGSKIAMASKEVDIEISQLNDLTNAGVQFPQSNFWEDVNVCSPTAEGVDIIIYRDLKNVINAVGTVEGMHTCIFLTPTSEKPYDAKKWQALGMTLISLVRLGTKLLAVSSPRGKQHGALTERIHWTRSISSENQQLPCGGTSSGTLV